MTCIACGHLIWWRFGLWTGATRQFRWHYRCPAGKDARP